MAFLDTSRPSVLLPLPWYAGLCVYPLFASSWEFGGTKFNDGTQDIPAFMTHYGLMNSQMQALDRRLPIQVVCYHMYLRMLHSGMSAEQVLALPPAEFGRFIGECCQITRDAALVPYERDTTVGVQISFSNGFGFGLGLCDTEDMVRPFVLLAPAADSNRSLCIGRVCHVVRRNF